MPTKAAVAWIFTGALLASQPAGADLLDRAIEDFDKGDYAAAHSSFTSTGEDGDVRAAPWLAVAYYVGWGTKPDERLAERWIQVAKTAATRGDAEIAVQHWRRLADAQDPAGSVAMGRAYEHGIGVTASPVEAYRWYKAAADRGYVRGQYALAAMHGAGIGVKADMKECLRLLNLAAAQGDDWAQYQIGNAYLQGTGVRRSFRAAGDWLTRAAQAGNPLAAYNLAVMYDEGAGFSKDYGEAFKWYQRAAAQGMPNAQNNLAVLYYRGQGVGKDVFTAYQFSTIAHSQLFLDPTADQQHLDFTYRKIQSELGEPQRRAAVFQLGERCRDGDGVPRDAVQAYAYMTQSIESEPDPALKQERTKARDSLAGNMRTPQVERAQSLAAERGLP